MQRRQHALVALRHLHSLLVAPVAGLVQERARLLVLATQLTSSFQPALRQRTRLQAQTEPCGGGRGLRLVAPSRLLMAQARRASSPPVA